MNETGDCDRVLRILSNGIPSIDLFSQSLVQYVKMPCGNASFNVKKALKAINGKLLDKKGNPISIAEYVKSVIEVKKVGVLIAFKDFDGTILIGWSQWFYDCDEYNKYTAFEIAIERAVKYKQRNPKRVPYKIQKLLPLFVGRAKSYYKDGTLVSWANV